MNARRHFFLLAGEASGDRLGASLMAGLKGLAPGTRFSGVGGPLMAAEGLDSLFPMDELSVMGIAEVLPRLPALLARVRQSAKAVTEARPDALITIDAPDFCLRVAARAKAENPQLSTIHYVAPTVWAWRPGRAAKMARHIDHVLALFPFEPPYMEAAGMGCDFVGHPVVADPQPGAAERAEHRARLGLGPDARLLLVLPGSRRGEVLRMGPLFAEVCQQISGQRPGTQFVIQASENTAPMLKEMLPRWPAGTRLLDPRSRPAGTRAASKRLTFAAADLALAASGTVSLELAAAETPMVISYRFNWLTTRIVKSKVKLDTATLVNILTKSRAIPEFLFEDASAAAITPFVLELLKDDTARAAQLAAEARAMALLGQGGEDPGLRAARAVLGVTG